MKKMLAKVYPLAVATALLFPLAAFAQQLPGQPTVHAPLKAGGVAVIDLPDSSAQSVTLEIVKGRFADYSVGKFSLTGSGIDFRSGTLQGLKTDISGGDFDNLLVDRLQMAAPAFAFDTMQLLNNHTFVLTQPVTAQVNLQISEDGINRFLSNPKTLSKIEKSIQKQTGGMKLLTFNSPNLTFQGGNKVRMTMNATVAQGLAVPMEMTGKLGIVNGQIGLSDLNILSGGNQIQLPVDVASTFQDKINELIDFKRLGKNSLVITADNMKVSGKTLIIDGHATLTRLQFGA
jgi:hypothetical protein